MKALKNTACVLLSLIILVCALTAVPLGASAAGKDYVAKGTLNRNGSVKWILKDDGTLIVYGQGEMYNYSTQGTGNWSPWADKLDLIKRVVVTDGVTNIGSNVFSFSSNLESATISKSVTSIGTFAFRCCGSLKSIEISDNVQYIGERVFAQCDALTSVVIGNGLQRLGDKPFFMCPNLTSATVYSNKLPTYGISYGFGITYIGTYMDEFTLYAAMDVGMGSFESHGKYTYVPVSGSVPGVDVQYYEADSSVYLVETTSDPSSKPSADPEEKAEIDVNISAWEAYDKSTNKWKYSVRKFDYALGSFAWNKKNLRSDLSGNEKLMDETNYDKLYLKLEAENTTSKKTVSSAKVELTAPEGFSFSSTKLSSKKTCTFSSLKKGVRQYKAVSIYPIFSLNYSDGAKVWMKAKVTSAQSDEKTQDISIGTIHKREKEGIIFVNIKDVDKELKVPLSCEMFASSPNIYSQELARLGIGLSTTEYCSDALIEESYKNLGFSQICNYGQALAHAGRNTVNHSFASKRIIIDGKIYTLIAAPLRGTIEKSEWVGNFDAFIKENGDHPSFRKSADDARTNLKKYMKSTSASLIGERKLFVTGHSRAAAVANLIGADVDNGQLSDYISADNTFVYTFATPNATGDDDISRERFDNIFNIIDYDDIVATVAPRFMGYNKYGKTYSFSLTSPKHSYPPETINKVKSIFEEYFGSEYDPLSEKDRKKLLGIFTISYPVEKVIKPIVETNISKRYISKIRCTHSPANYIAWMETLSGLEEMNFSEINHKKYREYAVKCPVDVEISDSQGTIVGRTVNGIVDESVSNQDMEILVVEGDYKIIVLTDADNYTVKTIGYDDGIMEICVTEYLDGEKEKVISFENVPVENGKYYTIQIEESENDNPSYHLLSESGGKIEPDVICGTDEVDSLKVGVSVQGSGSVTGAGKYTNGEVAILVAVPDSSKFLGWYHCGELMSSDLKFSFVVTDSSDFVAKFTRKDINLCKLSGIKNLAYTGKALTQKISIKNGGKTLKSGTDYTLRYKNNKKIGTATVIIRGKGNFKGTIKKTFKITKAKNPMTVRTASKSVKYSALKKKAQTVKPLTVKKAQGTKTFVKVSGNKKITVNKRTGAITVAKGLKKGTYTIKVKVTAQGNSNYKSAAKTVIVKVSVK